MMHNLGCKCIDCEIWSKHSDYCNCLSCKKVVGLECDHCGAFNNPMAIPYFMHPESGLSFCERCDDELKEENNNVIF